MHYSFKSTPTWTFKSRNQITTKANQASSRPGPSDYIVKKPLPQSATISSTKQKRQLWKPFQPNPGPGAYQAKSYTTAGQKRSMSARHLDYTKRTPGPHQYDNNTLRVKGKRPSFTMATRSKSYKQLTTEKNMYQPAPTAYDSFKGSFIRNTKTVIGTSNRKDLTETQKTPAPNYYMTEKADQFAARKNARAAIGQQFRNTSFGQGEVTPGPAFYDKKSFVQQNKDKNNGFSCRNKTTDLIALQLSKMPGPGAYQSHLGNKNKSARFAPPNTLRKSFMDDMQDFKKSYPGPGYHNPQLNSTTKYRSASAYNFSRANRKDLYQNQKTPAPDEYQNDKIGQLYRSPGYSVGKTIAKNQFLQVNPQLPGPGQYDPSVSLVKSKSKDYGIGKEVRPDFQKQRYTPGPGYYNLRGKQAGPAWKMGNQKRIAFTDNKSEAKYGNIYDIAGSVANPPKYLNVQSKISYSKEKNGNQSTGFSRKKK